MTQKEYSIIATINEEGLDNSMWGMSNATLDASYYGCNKKEELPPHIYIYGDDNTTYGRRMDELLRNGYDRKFYLDKFSTEFICFFWLDPKTL